MTRYKINGKKVNLPDGWHDVKFKHGVKILETEMNNIDIFSLFSGISKDEIRSVKNQESVYYFMQGFPFLNSLPDVADIPMSVKIDGLFYHLPFTDNLDKYDLGNASVGQIEDMKACIKNLYYDMVEEDAEGQRRATTALEDIKMKSYITAIYLQPFISGEYDYSEAMELREKLEDQLSFKDIHAIGNFFLLRLTGLTSGLQIGLLHRLWITKKLRQVFRRLIKTLDSMRH